MRPPPPPPGLRSPMFEVVCGESMKAAREFRWVWSEVFVRVRSCAREQKDGDVVVLRLATRRTYKLLALRSRRQVQMSGVWLGGGRVSLCLFRHSHPPTLSHADHRLYQPAQAFTELHKQDSSLQKRWSSGQQFPLSQTSIINTGKCDSARSIPLTTGWPLPQRALHRFSPLWRPCPAAVSTGLPSTRRTITSNNSRNRPKRGPRLSPFCSYRTLPMRPNYSRQRR